jgi:hypothetical protein
MTSDLSRTGVKTNAEIERRLREAMDRELTEKMTVTNAATPSGPSLNPEKLIAQMDRILREWRRAEVTLVVVEGHTGPATVTQHSTDGRFIECSYLYALRIHQEVPLCLHRVLARDRAEFRVASVFGPVSRLLPGPPFEETRHD